MSKILYCDSQGDKRFSALYAIVSINGIRDTIEAWYQKSKRNSENKIPGKGNPVKYFVSPYDNNAYDATELTKFYTKLWYDYIEQNPELRAVLVQYDKFIDRFAGKSINNQGDVLKDIASKLKKTDNIVYVTGSIFKQKADAIVIPVNCVGVTGKGLALTFSKKYPRGTKIYKDACKQGQMEPGTLQLLKYSKKNLTIINFPTKVDWKKGSSLEYIKLGLKTFVDCYKLHDIKSVAFPMLGCGCGGLKRKDVIRIMEQYLRGLDVKVYICTPDPKHMKKDPIKIDLNKCILSRQNPNKIVNNKQLWSASTRAGEDKIIYARLGLPKHIKEAVFLAAEANDLREDGYTIVDQNGQIFTRERGIDMVNKILRGGRVDENGEKLPDDYFDINGVIVLNEVIQNKNGIYRPELVSKAEGFINMGALMAQAISIKKALCKTEDYHVFSMYTDQKTGRIVYKEGIEIHDNTFYSSGVLEFIDKAYSTVRFETIRPICIMSPNRDVFRGFYRGTVYQRSLPRTFKEFKWIRTFIKLEELDRIKHKFTNQNSVVVCDGDTSGFGRFGKKVKEPEQKGNIIFLRKQVKDVMYTISESTDLAPYYYLFNIGCLSDDMEDNAKAVQFYIDAINRCYENTICVAKYMRKLVVYYSNLAEKGLKYLRFMHKINRTLYGVALEIATSFEEYIDLPGTGKSLESVLELPMQLGFKDRVNYLLRQLVLAGKIGLDPSNINYEEYLKKLKLTPEYNVSLTTYYDDRYKDEDYGDGRED